jgi:hypothetical protein
MAWQEWRVRGTLRRAHGETIEVFALERDEEAGLVRYFPLRFSAEVPTGGHAERMPLYEAPLNKFEPLASDA